MNTVLILIFALMAWSQASAFDQIILKNGDFLEGRIFSETPNDHYDIELTNGTKKRIKIKEIDEVKRDVPIQSSNASQNLSSKEEMSAHRDGSQNLPSPLGFFVAPQVGIILPLSGGSALFQYGTKFGFDLSRTFSLGISFRHSQSSAGFSLSNANNLLTCQVLFKNIGDTGFYVGPQIGANFAKLTSQVSNQIYAYYSNSENITIWDAGVDLGYEFYLSPHISLGPDVSYDHFFPVLGSDSGNALSIMALGAFHFN